MRLMNTEIFVNKSNMVHSNTYNYIKTVWVSNKSKVIITCLIHGDFIQSPNNHLSGFKCIKCSIEQRSEKRRSNDFIKKSKSKFGDKFDYERVIYINNSTNVNIECNEHGLIQIIPTVHLKSNTGCSKCSVETTKEKQKLNIDDILGRFYEKHGDRYNYSNINYINYNSKIEIICNEHGSFYQSPKRHLNGSGCPRCIMSIGECEILNILKKNSIKFETQFKFDDCFLKKPLRFDFYLPESNILIEYDGIQHFKPLLIFGGEKSFNLQLEKDKIKNEYCKYKNIILIRIKYDDNIEKKMNELLNEI
jgi:very-short-patch-repair endonuclease